MDTIAIIEDNLSNMKLIKCILEKAGYKTISADNARQGIDIVKAKLPALVLMDIQMPGLDGIEATKILKSDPETEMIPVLALTAKAMDNDREEILAAGCDAYTSKPIKYKELLLQIDALI